MPLKVTVWPFDLFISLSRRFCFCSEVPVLTSLYSGLPLNCERVYPTWPMALLKTVLNGIRACDRRVLLAVGSGRPQAATPLCSAYLSRPLRFVRVSLTSPGPTWAKPIFWCSMSSSASFPHPSPSKLFYFSQEFSSHLSRRRKNRWQAAFLFCFVF